MKDGPKLAERLLQVLEDYYLKLLEADVEHMNFQPPDGKWSCKEILGHLIDSASVNHERFVRSARKEQMIYETYDQGAWVFDQNYRAQLWDDVLQLWYRYNRHISHIIAQIPDETLLKKHKSHNLDHVAFHTIPKSRPATLAYFIDDYINHMIHHLEAIMARK